MYHIKVAFYRDYANKFQDIIIVFNISWNVKALVNSYIWDINVFFSREFLMNEIKESQTVLSCHVFSLKRLKIFFSQFGVLLVYKKKCQV